MTILTLRAFRGDQDMLDAIFLVVFTLLFVLLGAYAYACDKL
jgi:cbb3-type cytochrome oxidase subunit 3